MVMIDNLPSILFLWTYMAIIWLVVINAFRKKPTQPTQQWKNIFYAFFLLAFGDTFHLLPRTYLWYAYNFLGDTMIYESEIGIMIYGIGLIFTGITMTFFYLEFYFFWKNTYNSSLYSETTDSNETDSGSSKSTVKLDIIAWLSVISRVILILLPWNNWGSEPAYYYTILSFRLVTNIPLYVIGIEVLYLFFKSTGESKRNENISTDVVNATRKSAYWIIVSYACYTVTLLGVPINPMFGMFMIPKTIAYIVVVYYLNKAVLMKKA